MNAHIAFSLQLPWRGGKSISIRSLAPHRAMIAIIRDQVTVPKKMPASAAPKAPVTANVAMKPIALPKTRSTRLPASLRADLIVVQAIATVFTRGCQAWGIATNRNHPHMLDAGAVASLQQQALPSRDACWC